jgi:hypothetical protein
VLTNYGRLSAAASTRLHGLLVHWSQRWTVLLGWEEQQRARRSLARRLSTAHIGRFKPLCTSAATGPNAVGKSMLAQNIAHQALIEGHTVLFTSAGQLLDDLAALDSDAALRRRLRQYACTAGHR